MADLSKIVQTVIVAGKTIVEDDNVKSFLLGTYSDGSPRNLPDAMNGEFISPKQKKLAIYGSDSSKKKKKKKKKKKNNSVKFKL